MKQTVNFYDFEQAFIDMGRGDSFSYAGKQALFDFLEEMEEGCGEEMELDVVAIDCDFCEYGSALECVQDCGYIEQSELDDHSDCEEDQEEYALDYLRDNTITIEFDGGIIIQGF